MSKSIGGLSNFPPIILPRLIANGDVDALKGQFIVTENLPIYGYDFMLTEVPSNVDLSRVFTVQIYFSFMRSSSHNELDIQSRQKILVELSNFQFVIKSQNLDKDLLGGLNEENHNLTFLIDGNAAEMKSKYPNLNFVDEKVRFVKTKAIFKSE